MAIGSGLSGQLGIAQETTWGTAVAATRFVEINSETVMLRRVIVQGQGLRAGARFLEASRRSVVKQDAGGDVNLDLPSKGLGVFLQNMIGSTPTTTQQGATTAYQQVHTDGTLNGKSFTMQIGEPSDDGVVNPLTYPGCKIDAWEIACANNGIATLALTVDAKDEQIVGAGPLSLQTASLPIAHVFHFGGASLALGGTVATTGGLTTVTAPVAVPQVMAFSLKGDQKIKTDRFYADGTVYKNEQLENDFMAYTGEVDVQFANMTLYNQYRAELNLALTITLVGPLIASTYYETLEIILPAIRLEDNGSPQLGGPDVLTQTFPFTVFDDQSGTNPRIQMRYISTDTVV